MLYGSGYQAHPRSQNLLESESMGTGLFRPDIEDPELCNAESTTSWELSLLAKRHYHPTVQTLAGHLAAGAPSKERGSILARRWVLYAIKVILLENDSYL